MRFNWDLIDAHNTIGGAPRDIIKFCEIHEKRSFDALYLRACNDHFLLRKAIDLLKTGGLLGIRFSGGHPALCSRTTVDRMMSGAWNSRWWLCVCRDGDVIWTRICRPEDASTVPWESPPLAHYVDLLQRGIPFSYLRYNDGEWGSLLETIYMGPGYQRFTPELAQDLQASVIEYHRDPHYYMGLTVMHHFIGPVRQWELITAWLRENNLGDLKWVDAGTFNRASECGDLWPFIRELQRSDIIIVGPDRYRPLLKLFPRAAFVSIPETQCHAQLPAMEKAILAQKLPAIILITAGPACNVLIHKLYSKIGSHSTMIDMGSLWAPYIGKIEHMVHFPDRMTDEIMARNVGGKAKWTDLKRAVGK